MPERIRSIDPSEFQRRSIEIVDVYADALEQTSPWKEDAIHIPRDVTRARMVHEAYQGSTAIIAEVEGAIVGVSRFQPIDKESVRTSGEFFAADDLADFLGDMQNAHGIMDAVTISDTFVAPLWQNQGLATKLKAALIEKVRADYPQGILLVTAHRSDNPHIIRTSESLGFTETGIFMPHYDNPDISTQYWYKILHSYKST